MEEAMPHMVSLYRFSVHTISDPALAEDLVQETYTEAWQSFHLCGEGTRKSPISPVTGTMSTGGIKRSEIFLTVYGPNAVGKFAFA